jgi:hypothetical protein
LILFSCQRAWSTVSAHQQNPVEIR